MFDELIKKHEDLKNFNLVLKGVELITYTFIKIIKENTLIECPNWIKKNVQSIHKTKTISVFNILSLFLCFIKKLKTIQKGYLRLNPLSNLNWENVNFAPEEPDYKTFEINTKPIALNALYTERQETISHLYKSEFN